MRKYQLFESITEKNIMFLDFLGRHLFMMVKTFNF
jgi:hypothetical protein